MDDLENDYEDTSIEDALEACKEEIEFAEEMGAMVDPMLLEELAELQELHDAQQAARYGHQD